MNKCPNSTPKILKKRHMQKRQNAVLFGTSKFVAYVTLICLFLHSLLHVQLEHLFIFIVKKSEFFEFIYNFFKKTCIQPEASTPGFRNALALICPFFLNSMS
jgi:hypothetical protein